ncbi:MAG: MBL fold metallo-hydrolase [Syntrophomonadaceae bacterium]|nr:MBL fold metallo-hydrolase [Syntrophomonadaceae bacterium]
MANNDKAFIKFLGVRGSVPVSGAEFVRYGGDTSCVLVRLGGEVILLDAGTGMLAGEAELRAETGRLSILLTHPHIDHIQGLCSSTLMYEPGRAVDIYAAPRRGLSAQGQIEALMSYPLWPVGPEGFAAKVVFHDITAEPFTIGRVRVDNMESDHPGGSTIFRLSSRGVSIVYATDFEPRAEYPARLEAFARDCSLLIIDAQYSAQEYEQRVGWGHSSWEQSAELGQRCAARRVMLFHHEPRRTDQELDAIQRRVREEYPRCAVARAGEEITL